MPCVQIPQACPFVLVLFGCQYFGNLPKPETQEVINAFDSLLQRSKAHVEALEQDLSPEELGSSRVWMSYWGSPDDYQEWWNSSEVRHFWQNLRDDAGFWREKMVLHRGRSMFSTNKNVRSGLAHLGTLEPLTQGTSGYWGSYRKRLEEATSQNRLDSPLKSIKRSEVLVRTRSIRKGRIVISHFPENLCLVIEGQDYSGMQSAERKFWNEQFDTLARNWVHHVVNSGPEAGVVSARHCFARSSGKLNEGNLEATDDGRSLASNYKRQVEIFFFLDLSHFEKIGKTVKTHIDLRSKFMKSYMSHGTETNELLLWVELSVIKAQDMEAEYIGCFDGTGFLQHMGHAAFEKGTDAPHSALSGRSAGSL
ncbi:Hypothetical protein D9617_85g015880 [Elsinoe fawcettii]|nr:Hypothetical protein D9617_85g015880 [Elsinoe fawcettii]